MKTTCESMYIDKFGDICLDNQFVHRTIKIKSDTNFLIHNTQYVIHIFNAAFV